VETVTQRAVDSLHVAVTMSAAEVEGLDETMTALDHASVPDTGGLAALAGLEMAAGQLTPLVTVLRAEQARRKAGIAVSRPAWKNLVFTGGPGTGKSRAAAAIARLYRDLGVLSYGNLIELHAADLVGATARDTATQIREAVKVTGDLVMITGAHARHDLPDRGQHLLRCLYQILTEARKYHGDELALILPARPARSATCCTPHPRWPPGYAIADFPGYTPAQLTTVLQALATEAGLTLTPDAARKAAAVLADAERGHVTGNARLAVQLLTQATTNQADRVTTSAQPCDPAALCADDIPERMPVPAPSSCDQHPVPQELIATIEARFRTTAVSLPSA
jgi:AAA lid domain